jgi:NAD kinase
VYEASERNNQRTIVLKKTNTIRELIELIKNEACESFCDGGVLDDLSQVRLRYYDAKIKKCFKVFEDLIDI